MEPRPELSHCSQTEQNQQPTVLIHIF